MKHTLAIPVAFIALLCGCSAPTRLQEGPGAGRIGAPRPRVDAAPAYGANPEPEGSVLRMPERLALPASYRLMLLDGHLTLVRETDAQALSQAPTSMRIVMGEVSRGELAYQPALLPQEIAAEVAANRESSARMDNALAAVMQRSRELSERALALEAQSKRLADLLMAEEARGRESDPARSPGQPSPADRTQDSGAPSN
jgi:hypothetical protein